MIQKDLDKNILKGCIQNDHLDEAVCCAQHN